MAMDATINNNLYKKNINLIRKKEPTVEILSKKSIETFILQVEEQKSTNIIALAAIHKKFGTRHVMSLNLTPKNKEEIMKLYNSIDNFDKLYNFVELYHLCDYAV